MNTTEQEELILQLSERIQALELRVSELEAKAPRKKFIPPTLQEVEQEMYSKSENLRNLWTESFVSSFAKRFFNHYEANGWHVGKTKMKDWKAATRNWMNNEHQTLINNAKPNAQPIDSVSDYLAKRAASL